MANTYFQFKEFLINQDRCAMKVTTDACLFGAWVAKRIKENNSKGRLLDIGTGTGLLSLMIAQQNPGLQIDAIEIDADSEMQAKQNISASPWINNVNTIQADVRIYFAEKKYDLIISNPPFYENELKGEDPAVNKAHHDEGLLLKDIMKSIEDNLLPNGRFFLLFPFKRNAEIRPLVTGNGFHLDKMVFVRQTVNHDFFRVMLSGEKVAANNETAIEELSIRDGEGKYTDEFASLLVPYYLNL
jgi:tRNA1Val (adenine37-N6)-methyltransferase